MGDSRSELAAWALVQTIATELVGIREQDRAAPEGSQPDFCAAVVERRVLEKTVDDERALRVSAEHDLGVAAIRTGSTGLDKPVEVLTDFLLQEYEPKIVTVFVDSWVGQERGNICR